MKFLWLSFLITLTLIGCTTKYVDKATPKAKDCAAYAEDMNLIFSAIESHMETTHQAVYAEFDSKSPPEWMETLAATSVDLRQALARTMRYHIRSEVVGKDKSKVPAGETVLVAGSIPPECNLIGINNDGNYLERTDTK